MKYKVIKDNEIPVLTASMTDSGMVDQQKINSELVLIDDLLFIQKQHLSQTSQHKLMDMLEKRIEIEIS